MLMSAQQAPKIDMSDSGLSQDSRADLSMRFIHIQKRERWLMRYDITFSVRMWGFQLGQVG